VGKTLCVYNMNQTNLVGVPINSGSNVTSFKIELDSSEKVLANAI